MATEDVKIRAITKPSIKIDEIAIVDRTQEGKVDSKFIYSVDDKQTGYKRPYIVINNIRIDIGLTFFNLNLDGFLPECHFTFNMQDSLFLSSGYPKDGDVVSIYIRAVGDVYKPIRMDFNIISVDAIPYISYDGEIQTFTILAECRIPRLYTSMCRSFKNKTSWETLLEVSQDLELGFSTNDSILNDKMNWICPNISRYSFIKEVISRAYKDDHTYFSAWIDPFYNLNMVNMGNQFSITTLEPDIIRSQYSSYTGDLDDDGFYPGIEMEYIETPLILTNYESVRGLSNFIEKYTLISDAGQNTNKTGYISKIQMYDKSIEDNSGYIKYTIESITPDNLGNKTFLQRGRIKEDIYKDEIREIWMGGNWTGEFATTHKNYNHAKIQNRINLLDSSKFTLLLDFPRYLPFIYKGQVVPVNIWIKEDGKRKTYLKKNKRGEPVLDIFLSGLYVVSGMEITFSKLNGIGHRLKLKKKTWDLNINDQLL